MRRFTLVLLLSCFALAHGPAPTHAAWPKPAIGDSVSGAPEVVLSFDDGPDRRYTPRVLKILREHRVQGIFFWVGNRLDPARPHSDLRRAVAALAVLEGHLVGSHTVNHVHLCQLPPDEGAHEIDEAIERLAEATGLPMTLFRAPYGDHCPRVVELLDARGLEHVHWDVDPHEWIDHDSERVAYDIIEQLEHLQGRAMILMHDTTLVTVNALERILSWIDEENQRRLDHGHQAIRIIDASDWVAESLDPDLTTFVGDFAWHAWSKLKAARMGLVPGYPARMVRR